MEFISDLGNAHDAYRPSFFELAAQEQLRDLLQPVVKYVLSVFAQRHPRYLLRIVNRNDEFYAIMMFFIERHYLKEWGASFAENFYGLKRRRVPLLADASQKTREAILLTGNHEKLRRKERWGSLAALILVPYLRNKSRSLYESLGGHSGLDQDLFQDGDGRRGGGRSLLSRETLRQQVVRRLSAAYVAAYPYFNVLYEIWLLSYNVGYLFEKTPYWRPWLSLMGVEVRRMSAQDYRNARSNFLDRVSSPLAHDPRTGRRSPFYIMLLRYALILPRYAFEALKVLLPTSIFFFRFLEWWYSSDYARSRRGGAGGQGDGEKALRAPRRMKIHPESGFGTGADGEEGKKRLKEGMDPLTGEELVNATALPSGYVFSYRPVYEYVEKHGRCPVTFMPVGTGDLRKIIG